jgi:hypothetical protein
LKILYSTSRCEKHSQYHKQKVIHLANIWPTANNRKRGIAHDRSGVDRHSCLLILCKPQYLHYEICNFKKSSSYH